MIFLVTVGYLGYPGLVLVAVTAVTAVAAVEIARDRRFGWRLGTGVSVATWALCDLWEAGGLPGLDG